MESWFVPFVVDESLTGYVRVGASGQSFSAFGRRQDLAAWTDPDAVRRQVEALGHRVRGTPTLGYDGVPARLAWVVPLAGGGVAYVAGDAVWLAREGPAPSTG